MSKPNVFITRMIPEKAISYLREQCIVDVNPDDRPLTRDELLKNTAGRHAVMTMLTDAVDAVFFEAVGPQCRIVANYAVGYNNMDIPAATERGVFLSNTPDVLTDATADMAWALILATARRVVEGDAVVRKGRFSGWSPLFMLGVEVTGKTLGIIGAGRIGQATAKRAQGFNMRVLYTANSPKREFEAAAGARFVDLDTLLRESDFISLHVPLTSKTKHIIGAPEFGIMKKSAILVNTARGPVVDEKALVTALVEGRIRGAGLDVYEQEPLVEAGLRDLPNVVLAPHLGSSTLETRERMGMMAADNILRALAGEVPPQCLNPGAARR
ncbi:MAG TPA: D-glycerate dehydrogenase [Dissulfurispiraceae bacterium]|nr:D-glycerate dehydrogenase [Dissulfurispiraceae bacterium]